MEAACLSEGKDALDPAVSLVALGALASFAPENGKPYHPLAKVVGRFHPVASQNISSKKCIKLSQLLD